MRIRADIAELLHQGLPNHVIARQLHTSPNTVQKTREALGIPNLTLGPRPAGSPEELFAARTEPLPGGHLKWTGTNSEGSLKFRWQGRDHSATAIAFRIRTGRDPVGRARTSCDLPLCVAPAHVSDQAERDRDNAAFNALFGGAA